MRLHHFASLALVGWYLITPPVHTQDGKALVDPDASLWKWEGIARSFGSIADCEKARQKSQKQAKHDEEDGLEQAARMDANPDERSAAAFEASHVMKCVPTDDPRLKRK